jgi:hypothetical protein
MYIKNIGHPELDHYNKGFQIDDTDTIPGTGVPTINYFLGAKAAYNWDWPTTVRMGIQYCPPSKIDR